MCPEITYFTIVEQQALKNEKVTRPNTLHLYYIYNGDLIFRLYVLQGAVTVTVGSDTQTSSSTYTYSIDATPEITGLSSNTGSAFG